MMLTTKGRYAVTAMVDLAICSDGNPYSLVKISESQGIALSYLEQIFMKLRKASLVKSVKGPRGGYLLNHNPENIKISHIIDAVDESVKMTKCKTDNHCFNQNHKCYTHNLWHGLGNNIKEYLDSVTVADICDNANSTNNKKLMSHGS